MTKEELDNEVLGRVAKISSNVDNALSKYTLFPDTVSPQIKEGLIDIEWQTGNIKEYPKLLQSIASGDIKGIENESGTTFTNQKTGEKHFDKKHHDERIHDYFHYGIGGIIGGPVGTLIQAGLPPKIR